MAFTLGVKVETLGVVAEETEDKTRSDDDGMDVDELITSGVDVVELLTVSEEDVMKVVLTRPD
jgi:hypothetical protein